MYPPAATIRFLSSGDDVRRNIGSICKEWGRTLVLRFVVEAQLLRFALDADNRTRIAGVCLDCGDFEMCPEA